MLRFSNIIFILGACLAFGKIFAQDCSLQIKVQIIDEHPNTPLQFANVYLKENYAGASTNSQGNTILSNVCPGEYHLVVSHIACEAKEIFLTLAKDTSIQIYLSHATNMLDASVVHGESGQLTAKPEAQISASEIQDDIGQNFADVLDKIAGVTSLRNGAGISKPVIQGLSGNRLTILNNGISQSGQQWGNDHSPEIDPLVASRISVIKGASALEYFGGNLGAIVILEPEKIQKDPHVHGKLNYQFSSNGLGHGVNFQLQQGKAYAWKFNATLKKSGDHRSASYFQNNTGSQEANVSLQVEKSFASLWKTSLYLSSFNATIGVLRGSHIGNLTDLEDALEQKVPFYTEDAFSYAIDAPKQQVHHQLVKLQAKYFVRKNQLLEFTAAGQWNLRKEFDVRRSGRSTIPALNISQITGFFATKYQIDFKQHWRLKTGVQFNFTDNTNNPETGILPLIPDYRSYQTGLFVKLDKKIKKSFFESAMRYDLHLQNVAAISQTTPRAIVRYANNFNNVSASLGWKHQFNHDFSVYLNSSYATRNPAINELYSGGLHQGVSGIEEGDPLLQSEKSWKSSLGLVTKIKEVVFFEGQMYYQNIRDYIYLQPQDEIRLTIRGAFPVFKYTQTNAQIYGFDLSGQFQLTDAFSAHLNYSFIKGDDLTQKQSLINMPANQVYGSLQYEFERVEIGKKHLEKSIIEINNRFVSQQKNLNVSQDFVAPPNAYNLIGLKLSTDLQTKRIRYHFLAKIDNLLNVSYRDYLNRQRYFSDDLGVNVTVGVKMGF